MFEKAKETIRAIFGSASEPQAHVEEKKSTNPELTRLLAFLDKTNERLAHNLANHSELNANIIHSFFINCDTFDFSKNEMDQVGEKILALHELAMKYDFELETGGFDRLPRDGTSSSFSWNKGRGVNIQIYTGRTYNHFSHPQYNSLRDRGINGGYSKERPNPGGGLATNRRLDLK